MKQEAGSRKQETAANSAPRQMDVVNSQVGVIGDYARVDEIHFHIEPPANPRERRNRAAMLQLVHNTWIKGVLEQSLHGAALLELGLEYHPEAEDHPWDMVVQMPERPDKAVPPGTCIVDVFDELGGSLLILGEPGAGKTTMLLKLARDLIARAEQDETLHIPVVFNLSSWNIQQAPLADWLLEELNIKYHIPRRIARPWIAGDQLLLLLDGLDEVKAEARRKCVGAINAFCQEHLAPLVVCCRTADYAALPAKLHLQGAVGLRALTSAQIETYLTNAGAMWQTLHTALQHTPVLRELAQSPLMLNIMVLAYKDVTEADLQAANTPEAHRRQLFDTYIRQMFQRRGKAQPYSWPKTITWLVWLAQQMTAHKQSVFLIEELQPDWLPQAESRRVSILAQLLMMNQRTLSFGLVRMETPARGVSWSWKEAREKLVTWLAGGFLYGLIGGLVGGLNAGIVDTFFSGLLSALGGGVLGVLLGGLAGTLFGGLAIGLRDGLVIKENRGKSISLLMLLLVVFALTDRAPWKYARFLDYCVDRILLRRVGGGYIFIHRLLQEHFASLTPEDIERLAAGTEGGRA